MSDGPFGAPHRRGQDDLRHGVQGDLPASARPGAVRRVAAGGGDEAWPGGGSRIVSVTIRAVTVFWEP